MFSLVDDSDVSSYRVQGRDNQWLHIGLFCRGTSQEENKFRSVAEKNVCERGIESGII